MGSRAAPYLLSYTPVRIRSWGALAHSGSMADLLCACAAGYSQGWNGVAVAGMKLPAKRSFSTQPLSDR
jgi:hypothetical protein